MQCKGRHGTMMSSLSYVLVVLIVVGFHGQVHYAFGSDSSQDDAAVLLNHQTDSNTFNEDISAAPGWLSHSKVASLEALQPSNEGTSAGDRIVKSRDAAMTTIYGPREVVQGEFYSYIATLTLPTTSPYRESLQNLGAGESGNRGLVACVYLQPPSSSYMETVRPTAASRDSQRCTEDVHLNEKNDASGVTQFLVSLPDLSFTELGEASLQTFWYEAVTGDVLASSQLFLKVVAPSSSTIPALTPHHRDYSGRQLGEAYLTAPSYPLSMSPPVPSALPPPHTAYSLSWSSVPPAYAPPPPLSVGQPPVPATYPNNPQPAPHSPPHPHRHPHPRPHDHLPPSPPVYVDTSPALLTSPPPQPPPPPPPPPPSSPPPSFPPPPSPPLAAVLVSPPLSNKSVYQLKFTMSDTASTQISAGAGREAFLSAIQKALAQFFQVSETDVEVQIVRISGSGDITGISGTTKNLRRRLHEGPTGSIVSVNATVPVQSTTGLTARLVSDPKPILTTDFIKTYDITDVEVIVDSDYNGPPSISISSSSSSSKTRNVGAIAGGIIGGVAALAIVIAVVVVAVKLRRSTEKHAHVYQVVS